MSYDGLLYTGGSHILTVGASKRIGTAMVSGAGVIDGMGVGERVAKSDVE